MGEIELVDEIKTHKPNINWKLISTILFSILMCAILIGAFIIVNKTIDSRQLETQREINESYMKGRTEGGDMAIITVINTIRQNGYIPIQIGNVTIILTEYKGG